MIKGVDLADLTETITIEAQTRDVRTGEESGNWLTQWDFVPAALRPMTGGEPYDGDQLEAFQRVRFIFHNVGVTVKHRIRHNDVIYGITYIPPLQLGQVLMEVHAQAVVS